MENGNFKYSEDVMLLEAVIAVRPWNAPHGKTIDWWSRVTDAYAKASGKRASAPALQRRFHLLDQHHKYVYSVYADMSFFVCFAS
jgi:hypothetical protein